jgi:hypothetical protein
MGADFGHLFLLHWCLHADSCVSVGSNYQFPWLLFCFDGKRTGVAYCEYKEIETLPV